jgi:hypothetical protein
MLAHSVLFGHECGSLAQRSSHAPRLMDKIGTLQVM